MSYNGINMSLNQNIFKGKETMKYLKLPCKLPQLNIFQIMFVQTMILGQLVEEVIQKVLEKNSETISRKRT